jgi:hypothetical protein
LKCGKGTGGDDSPLSFEQRKFEEGERAALLVALPAKSKIPEI